MGQRKWLNAILVGFSLNIFVLSVGFGEEEFINRGEQRGLSFLSGGVGLRERELLKEMGKNYSLKMIFSNQRGEYLANVTVKIMDTTGKTLLVAVSNGPWFFADLPPGTYHLEASSRGEWKRISQVSIEEGSQRVVSFRW